MTAPLSPDARPATSGTTASERSGAERDARRRPVGETAASGRIGPEPRAPGRLVAEPRASRGAPAEGRSPERTSPGGPTGAESSARRQTVAEPAPPVRTLAGTAASERSGHARPAGTRPVAEPASSTCGGSDPPARGRSVAGPPAPEGATGAVASSKPPGAARPGRDRPAAGGGLSERGEPRPRLRVGFLLAPRFTLSAFANFVDVLRLAADEGDRSRPILCDWRVLSPSGAAVRSSCGVVVAPDERPSDPRRFDYVAVVGGLLDEVERLDPASVAFLERAADAGVPLVGLCTGAFALHEAGLMEGRRACVSWFHHEDFLHRFEGLQPVSDRIFVVDRGRLTCSGGVGSAHLAAWLVERHVGRAAARKSLAIMIVDEAHEPDDPQPGPPFETATRDPLVRRALLAMHQSLDAPPTVAELARRLGVDRRRLERRFREALGQSPARAGRALRLAHARHLLASGVRSVAEIAAETGFCDASHLTRAFRGAEGTTPEAWRRARGPEG